MFFLFDSNRETAEAGDQPVVSVGGLQNDSIFSQQELGVQKLIACGAGMRLIENGILSSLSISTDGFDDFSSLQPNSIVGFDTGKSWSANCTRQWTQSDSNSSSTEGEAPYRETGFNLWGQHSDNPLAAITPEAVHQGTLGDCYFLAAVAAEAQANPQALLNMIKDNGDGTYTVTFPGAVNKPITVDAPTEHELDAYAHYDEENGMWVNVLEKAHRQLTGRQTSDSGDSTDAGIKLLSPKSSPVVDDDLSGGLFKIGRTRTSNVRKDIINGLKDHKLIVASTSDSDSSWWRHLGFANNPGGYTANHAWAIIRYDQASNTITLRNPHGGTDGTDEGTFTVSLDDFYNHFQVLAFSNSA